MTEEIKKLQEERNKLYRDFFNNITPARMPVSFGLHKTIPAEYAGLDAVDVQFDYSKMEQAVMDFTGQFYADKCPFGPIIMLSRVPGCYQAIDSQTFIMGSSPTMQHPEVEGMKDTEYEQLIQDPYACIVENVLPRQHKAFGFGSGVRMMAAVDMMRKEEMRQFKLAASTYVKKEMDTYGYYNGAPAGCNGFTSAPFDFLGDQLRGFSNITIDVRRRRQQVKDACEALLPIVFNLGLPSNPHPEGSVGMPLHMAPYMREKDFAELWFPTMKKQAEQYAARGIRLAPFAESDWMRFVDYLQDLPAGTIVKFEKGDPAVIKQKLGNKLMLSGLFPLIHLRTCTEQEIIDKAKELLDIMLPGSGYLMEFDKGPLSIDDINVNNLRTLTEFVRDYARYDNAGEPFGQSLNSECFAVDESIEHVDSSYFINWESYKQKYPRTPDSYQKVLEQYDREIMVGNLKLLV